MKFCDRLNLYIETLGCSAKTLSAASGISDAAISRYRSGEREPGRDSEQLLRLAQGICAIAAESDYSPGFSEGEVLCALRASLHTEKSDFDSAVQNLKNLLTAFGIAVALRKGLHLDIIHNIDRPFEEMMLGLESWIPIYMTGQVSPYYLKGVQNTVYCHFHYVSGAAALTGECINGFHEDGHYHFTNNREEVQHSRRIADHLLQKAQPLMEIYKTPQADLFRAFLKNDAATVGARQNILSAPPLYTMPEDLLGRILKRSGMSTADAESINATLKQQTENIEQILTANTVIDELPHVSEEAFRASPLTLSLSNAFIENTVTYTYEEYTAHLKATKIFAEQHPNYTVRFAEKPAFRNIQIQIHENEWVMLSKSKAPAIHFVIRHSKMLSAFQNMILPYVED